MTLFNTCSKQLVYATIHVAVLLSLAIIGGSLYVMLVNWGPVNGSFLYGPCLTSMMYGVINFGGAILGFLGLKYQYLREGVFTHRFILGAFILVQLACIAVEIWAYVAGAKIVTNFHDISDSLAAGNTVSFDPQEKYLAYLFNNLFFGSAGSCTAVRTIFFWSWVADNCPSGLQESVCLKCFPYSVGSCQADQNTCYSSTDQDGYTCPYTICRQPILSYFVQKVNIVEICAIALMVFQCFLVALVALLIIHHEVKIDLRRGSIMRRQVGQKPKTLGRKRKTMLANQQGKPVMIASILTDLHTALQNAAAAVRNQTKFQHLPKDEVPEEVHDVQITFSAPPVDV